MVCLVPALTHHISKGGTEPRNQTTGNPLGDKSAPAKSTTKPPAVIRPGPGRAPDAPQEQHVGSPFITTTYGTFSSPWTQGSYRVGLSINGIQASASSMVSSYGGAYNVSSNIDSSFGVVSGLPRSGTSLMMQILEAAGLTIFTDGKRAADPSNQKSCYEHGKTGSLMTRADPAWLSGAKGKALKVVAPLLASLPLRLKSGTTRSSIIPKKFSPKSPPSSAAKASSPPCKGSSTPGSTANADARPRPRGDPAEESPPFPSEKAGSFKKEPRRTRRRLFQTSAERKRDPIEEMQPPEERGRGNRARQSSGRYPGSWDRFPGF